MSAWRSYSRVVFYTLLALLILAGFIQYDKLRQRAGIPEEFRFIPVDPSWVIYTTSIEQTWEGLTPHLSPLFGDSETEAATYPKKARESRESLEQRCIDLSSSSGLRTIGIDPLRAGIIAAYDQRFVSVLPIVDPAAFTRFVGESSIEPMELEFYVSDDLGRPERFRFHREGKIDYGRMCRHQSTEIVFLEGNDFEIEPDTTDGAIVFFMPDIFEPGQLHLQCRAVFADGTEEPCKCGVSRRSSAYFKSNAYLEGGCLDEMDIDPDSKNKESYSIHPFDVANNKVDGIDGELFGMFKVFFPAKGTGLLVRDKQMLPAALKDTTRNLNLHYDNDDLRAVTDLRSGATEPVSRLLLGTVQLPGPLSVQTSRLALTGNENRLELLAHVNLVRPGATILNRLASVNESSPKVNALLASQAALIVNDPYTSYFLSYAMNHIHGVESRLKSLLGNFHVILDELSRSPSVEGIGLHLIDLRDGFPEMALAIAIDEAQASVIVRSLQQKLRRARDLAILDTIAERFAQEHGRAPGSVQELTSNPGGFLMAEANPTWRHYKPGSSGFLLDDSGLPGSVFSASDYRVISEDSELEYLLPPVTDNDLAYRFDDAEFDDKEKEALKNGDDRPATTYNRDSGMLWIGTDAEILLTLLRQAEDKTNLVSQEMPLPRTTAGWFPKISLVLQPVWLLDQGLNHPEEALQSWAEEFLDLERYRLITMTINAVDEGGISASVQLIVE